MNRKNDGKRMPVNVSKLAHERMKERSKTTGIKIGALYDDAVFSYLKLAARVPQLPKVEA